MKAPVQCTEDQTRTFSSNRNVYAYNTRNKGTTGLGDNTTRTGPPKKTTQRTEIDLVDDQSVPNRGNDGISLRKEIPYVDVPVLKRGVTRSQTSENEITRPVRQNEPGMAPVKSGPAYKNRAPVEEAVDIEKLVETVLDVNVTVPLRSLAGASNTVREEIRKQVTRLRKPVDKMSYLTNLPEEGKSRNFINVDYLPVSTGLTFDEVNDEVPEGHLVADDPVLQYLRQVEDAKSEDLLVAHESAPLRSIYCTINGIGQEECLLDCGSQIVSMSKAVAVKMGLNWDPTIRINMESASNHIEKTLGLARNVGFLIGGLTIFRQVHILENPPYNILLGRPFEVFTCSIIENLEDESVMLTLTDPNSKRKITMPTYKRGESPDTLQKQRLHSF
jgi:hypothetical protein